VKRCLAAGSERRGRARTAALCVALSLAVAASAHAQGWKNPSRRAGDPAAEGARAERERATTIRGGIYSNLGLLDVLTEEAVRQIADSLALPEGGKVTLMAATWHEANWYVGQYLGEVLAARGHDVRLGSWGAPAGTSSASAAPPPARAQVPGRPVQSGVPASGAPQDPGEDGDDELLEAEEGDTTGAYADSVAAAAAAADPLWGSSGADAAAPAGDPAEPSAAPPAEPPSHPRPGGAAVPGAPASGGAGPAGVILPEGTVIDLRVLEFGIGYPAAGRRFLFGPLRFTRVGGVSVQATWVEGPHGRFRRMASAERHRVDRLSGSQRALVEGAGYPFTPPVLNPPSLGRYVEPAVVTAIIGSLVYLFYTNQK